LQKTLILIIAIIASSCNARLYLSKNSPDSVANTPENIISDISKNNLSQESFFIEKGDLVFKTENSTGRYIFTLKYEKPDKFLVSIRSLTGLEGARIFMTKDTILVNDRIRKRILYGKPERFENISGFPYYCIYLIFGDIILSNNGKIIPENENSEHILLQKIEDKTIRSVPEGKLNKIRSVLISGKSGKVELSINYSKFSKSTNHFPEVIDLKEYNKNISARIKIRKLQRPWTGSIEFLPGRDYKKEEIR
jgi:hypothetical protein